MKEKILQVATRVWTYMEQQVAKSLPGYLPVWLADLVADVGAKPYTLCMRPQSHTLASLGLASALDLTYEASYEWTGAYFYEELHGIADGKFIPQILL